MMPKLLEKVVAANKKKTAPDFEVGDMVAVEVKIREGGKERIQTYTGTVVARKGGGSTETFTVRRVSHGVGVERVFPVHSPCVVAVKVERRGRARRAKLYYLRGLTGKKAKLRSRDEKRS